MPRLAFPARGDGQHHRPPTDRDRHMFALRFATFVVSAGLIGGFLLLDAGEDPAGDTRAGESGTTSEHPSGSRPAPPASSLASTPPAIVAPPLVRAETTRIVPQSPPPASSRPPSTHTPPQVPGGPRFAVVGRSCDPPGAFGLTRDNQPVLCRRDESSGSFVWQSLF